MKTNETANNLLNELLIKKLTGFNSQDQTKLLSTVNTLFEKLFTDAEKSHQLNNLISNIETQFALELEGESLTKDRFLEIIKNQLQLQNSVEIFKFLETQGYDLWFQKVNYMRKGANLLEQPKFIQTEQIIQLMKLVQVDLCKETKAVLSYQPTNIRFIIQNPLLIFEDNESPINYESHATYVRYQELVQCGIHDVRFTWAIIKKLNQCLSDCINFVNMQNVSNTNDIESTLYLSLANYVSNYREIIMNPIKIAMAMRALSKTAQHRDFTPKVTVERIKMAQENDNKPQKSAAEGQSGKNNFQDIVNFNRKDEFIFAKAYEQMKDISTSLLRPLYPQGNEPSIAFEVIFKGEHVQGLSGPYRQFFADISLEL